MDFNEEYLDELLKSIEPIIGKDESEEEATASDDSYPDTPEEELLNDVAEPAEMDEPEPVTEPEPEEDIASAVEPETLAAEDIDVTSEAPAVEEIIESESEAPVDLGMDIPDEIEIPEEPSEPLELDMNSPKLDSLIADLDAEDAAEIGGLDVDVSAQDDIGDMPDLADLADLANLDDLDLDSVADSDMTSDTDTGLDSDMDVSLESLLSDAEEGDIPDASGGPEEIDLSDLSSIDEALGNGSETEELMDETGDIDAGLGDIGLGDIGLGDIGEEQELDLDMSPDEIDAMLNAAKSAGSEEEPMATEDGDELMSLLASAGDEDLGDIQSLLDSDENGEAVDETALLQATSVEDIASGVLDTPEEAKAKAKEDKKAAKAKAKEEKKAAKAAKRAAKGGDSSAEAADGETDAPKQGFFARILNSLTESLDEEDEAPVREAIPDDVEGEIDITALAGDGAAGGEMVISDENKEILDELDKEKGKKKGKKKKKKKGKKGKEGDEGAEEGGEDDEEIEIPDKKKKKKERKKKEKAPKAEEVPSRPEKKLPKKRVRATFILCLSILAGIIILTIVVTNLSNLSEARYAYDTKDYQTAYEDLYGLELDEDDQEIFNKSQIMLMLDRKLRSFQNYRKLGMDDRALHALLEGVKMYPEILMKAEEYGVVPQVSETYAQLLEGLASYGLTEGDALEINAYDSKVKYTKRIDSIVHGTPFTYDEDIAAEYVDATVPEEPEQPQSLDDILPQETDFLPDDPNSIFDEQPEPDVLPEETGMDEGGEE